MTQQNDYLEQVQRILAKLAQVRAANLACFGSEKHAFRLNPPLSEARVRDFETTHGIELPADYRAFLLHAGNGGAGPYYGIFPLHQWDDFAAWVLDDIPEAFLAQPCLLRRDMPVGWAEAADETSLYQGTLSVGSQGCTYATQLILSGPYAGRVVYVDTDDSPPYIAREPNFLAWYERWLDELLQGYRIFWFGYGPGGSEGDFFRLLDDPASDNEEKSEAASAFLRLPRLSEQARERVGAFFGSPLAEVRAGMLAVVKHFQLEQYSETAGQLLDDPSPIVREQAVATCMALDVSRWHQAVLLRLDDAETDVARAAFTALEKAKLLAKPALLTLLRESPTAAVRQLAARSITWSKDDVPLLVAMLDDTQREIRRTALNSLREFKDRRILPAMHALLEHEQELDLVSSALRLLAHRADRSSIPVLLKWAESSDDFLRLEAVGALVQIGDERAMPFVRAMLEEHRPPVRRDADVLAVQSHAETISTLVRRGLQLSPNRKLRKLAR